MILSFYIPHIGDIIHLSWGFPCGSGGKESTCHAADTDLIPELGISFGEGNGNPLQYSCLENSTYKGAWQAIKFMGLQRVRHD